MKILILNQAFYPDVVSTAQHATDLAIALVDSGHQVTVICGRRGYDDASQVFPHRETWRGIKIIRVWSTTLGKAAKWRRATDFATFILACTLRMLMLPRVDVTVSLTTPPLISFVAALLVPLKARRLVLWSMDLNPDEAIAAGWLNQNSLPTRLLSRMLRYSLQRADRIVALDRFMKDRIQAKGIAAGKISVIPPWSHDDHVHFDPAGRDEFRLAHGLADKFVVMYSGNHSPCHPLDSLIAASERLGDRQDIMFCFVGGGSEYRKIRDRIRLNGMTNVRCIPYQPLEKLSASLSAADLHVVVLGTPFVGIVHPSKIYNILAVGKRFLYIGPEESHVTDIMKSQPNLKLGERCGNGEVDQVIASILHAREESGKTDFQNIAAKVSKKVLLPQMLRAVEEGANAADSRNAIHGRLGTERQD